MKNTHAQQRQDQPTSPRLPTAQQRTTHRNRWPPKANPPPDSARDAHKGRRSASEVDSRLGPFEGRSQF
jgi:hypothetical protein